jgi:hypothetical protein
MGTKANPSPNDIYNRLDPEEPYIAFAGRDALAGGIARYYAALLARNWELAEVFHKTLMQIARVRRARPEKDNSHIQEARHVADDMDLWFEQLQKGLALAPAEDVEG